MMFSLLISRLYLVVSHILCFWNTQHLYFEVRQRSSPQAPQALKLSLTRPPGAGSGIPHESWDHIKLPRKAEPKLMHVGHLVHGAAPHTTIRSYVYQRGLLVKGTRLQQRLSSAANCIIPNNRYAAQ
jgi:hypothetical protein